MLAPDPGAVRLHAGLRFTSWRLRPMGGVGLFDLFPPGRPERVLDNPGWVGQSGRGCPHGRAPRKRGKLMYIGIGTIVLIVIIVLVVLMLRRR